MNIQSPLPGLDLSLATDVARASQDLRDYPNVTGQTLMRHGRQIGRAGEELVASVLRRYGIPVLELEDAPIDRMILLGQDMVGLQIKTITHPDAGGTYRFQIRMGCNGSGEGRRGYSPSAFHICALVVLPENVVRFSASHRQSQRIHPGEIGGLRRAPLASLEAALAQFGLTLDGPDADAPTL
ncbi:MAG: hypothetical protein SYC29_00835 [Planctomycetota bacterium]|nr:hypothetical protein [Planctomycetota bacterium]